MIVQRGNKQLRIAEEQKDAYLREGYDVLDETGKIVRKADGKREEGISAARHKKELEEAAAGYELRIKELEAKLKKAKEAKPAKGKDGEEVKE